MARLEAAESAAAEAQREASELKRRLIHELRAEGLSVRDVGTIVGVSPQRVSQLAS